jgi:hypothetical protein
MIKLLKYEFIFEKSLFENEYEQARKKLKKKQQKMDLII